MESISFLKRYENRQKKRNRIKKILIFVSLLILIVTFVVSYYFLVVNKVIVNIAQANVKKILTDSVNIAIEKTLYGSEIKYDDLVVVVKDKNEKISSITTNSIEINKISNSLAKSTQESLEKNTTLGINIPIGTCSGISIFNGKGSDVNFSLSPIGNVVCLFNSEFVKAGINQTQHKIYITIQADINVNLPIKNCLVSENVEFLICESIIVGDIPSTYFDFSTIN